MKNEISQKTKDSLERFSKLLNKPIPSKIAKSKRPQMEASRVLLKWSQEYGKLKQKGKAQ